MPKKSIIALYADGITHLIPAITIKVDAPKHPLPNCAWCKTPTLTAQLEYVQLGAFVDKHTLLCGCPVCQNVTVFVYELHDEELHLYVETK